MSLVGFAILLTACLATFGYWHALAREHNARLNGLDLRLHVNGIRGKSTVTRLLAGVLREGGYVTVAKTTGSAAREPLSSLPVRCAHTIGTAMKRP